MHGRKMDDFKEVVKYLEAVIEDKASVDRFAPVTVDELAKEFKDINVSGSPFP